MNYFNEKTETKASSHRHGAMNRLVTAEKWMKGTALGAISCPSEGIRKLTLTIKPQIRTRCSFCFK